MKKLTERDLDFGISDRMPLPQETTTDAVLQAEAPAQPALLFNPLHSNAVHAYRRPSLLRRAARALRNLFTTWST